MIKIIGGEPSLRLDKVYHKDEIEKIIGVDKGAYTALTYGIDVDYAIGDFDSVTPDQLNQIRKHARELIRHPSMKDKSDTELALDFAINLNPHTILIYGATGARLDHFIVNMNLLEKYKDLDIDISIVDELNKLTAQTEGKYYIYKSKYKYFSLFSYEDSVINIKNSKYNLERYKLTKLDNLCVSNEIVGDHALIEVLKGSVLIVQSRDR